jgi:hypothetical protein
VAPELTDPSEVRTESDVEHKVLWPLLTSGYPGGLGLSAPNHQHQTGSRSSGVARSTGIGSDAGLFVLRPGLEAVLGIARDARDKPRRIADALEGVDLEQPPATLNALLDAVKAAMQDPNSRG